jgi:hypothetical protein
MLASPSIICGLVQRPIGLVIGRLDDATSWKIRALGDAEDPA